VFTLFSSHALASLCKTKLANVQTPANLSGKTIIITGATFGIGKETALGLARTGAEVVIVGRDQKKSEETVNWLKSETKNEKVHYLLADLSLLKEVKKLADEIKKKYPKVDVLVNNAGAIFTHKEMTAENIEKTWALNHLSPMLLTLELIDVLKAAEGARVVNVASALYEKGQIPDPVLGRPGSYKGFAVYSDSKLAAVLTTFKMAKELETLGIQVNCLHPGFVDTGIGTNNAGLMKWVLQVLKPVKSFLSAHTSYIMTPAEGAKTSIYLASSPHVEGVTGKYFFKNEQTETTTLVQDSGLQEKVWEMSLKQIQEALK
jgi:retinol dehydrogenase 12